MLSDGDRRALAATPALRGADPAPPDPAVDLTDPAAVARAYLTAAHSLGPGDAGHTQRRAAGFAQPGSPAAVGVVVLDPAAAGRLPHAWSSPRWSSRAPRATGAATGPRCAPRPHSPAARSRSDSSTPSS